MEKKKKKREEKVSGCSGGMSRVGNLSVSTHVSRAASCSSGTVHLSACVSARLAVWHPLLPTLPGFEREQSHYFSHGDEGQPLIYPPTRSLAAPSSLAVTTLHKSMRSFFFFCFLGHMVTFHTLHNEESLQGKRTNACSNHDTPKHGGGRLTTVFVL